MQAFNGTKKLFKYFSLRHFLILLIPVLLTIAFTVANNLYSMSRYKSLLVDTYSNTLNSFLTNNEAALDTILSNTQLIFYNQDVQRALTTTTYPEQNEFQHIYAVISTLKELTNSSDLIYSAVIYNKAANFVISSSGMYTSDSYFNEICNYEQYTTSYWNTYTPPLNTIKLHSPSRLLIQNTTSPDIVIPISFTPANTDSNNSLVILNIDTDSIYSSFRKEKYTQNTSFYMIDVNTNEYITSNKSAALPEDIITDVLRVTHNNINSKSIDGKKHLILTSTNRTNIWGYQYVITLPYSDINRTVNEFFTIIVILTTFLVFVLLFYYLLIIEKINRPYINLATQLNSVTPISKDLNLISYVQEAVKDVISLNDEMKKDLSVTLPISQEKYLIEILNNDTPVASELKDTLFKYDYFMSIAIYCNIKDEYYTNSIPHTDTHLKNMLNNAILSVFAEKFVTFSLPATNELLYLFLNLPDDNCEDLISQTIDTVNQLVNTDREYVDIRFYTGNIYPDIDGLKQTHKEVISKAMHDMNSLKIHLSPTTAPTYLFGTKDEGLLTKYLISGQADSADELITGIFNRLSGMTQQEKDNIYTDILFFLYRYVKQRNISNIGLINSEKPLDSINDIISHEDIEIQTYIRETISLIFNATQPNTNTKVNVQEIIDYINNHYTDDIFLETLAEKFNTTEKYLSKRLKQVLNMNFKDYLTTLRIEKAKELLKNTDLKINDVCIQSGFYNRSTFIRAFKLCTGVSPSDYRNLN